MPHTLLSTGNEGRNQEGHAMVGSKDDILSSLCRHHASAARNKMNAPVDNHVVSGYYRVDAVEIIDMGEILKIEKDELERTGKSSKYKGFDKALRICLRLSNYKALEKPFIYGLDRNAAIGVALKRYEFNNYVKSSKD